MVRGRVHASQVHAARANASPLERRARGRRCARAPRGQTLAAGDAAPGDEAAVARQRCACAPDGDAGAAPVTGCAADDGPIGRHRRQRGQPLILQRSARAPRSVATSEVQPVLRARVEDGRTAGSRSARARRGRRRTQPAREAAAATSASARCQPRQTRRSGGAEARASGLPAGDDRRAWRPSTARRRPRAGAAPITGLVSRGSKPRSPSNISGSPLPSRRQVGRARTPSAARAR